MHVRVGTVMAVVVLGMLAAGAPAAGQAVTSPLQRFAEGFARSDGDRFVVISRASRTDPDGTDSVAAYNERTRRTRLVAGGCPVVAVGSGFLLVGCIDQPWRVFDLARGTDQAIAPIPWEPAPPGNNDRINTVAGIGSRWLAFRQESSPHGNVIVRRYENWHTGRVLPEPGAASFPDLDVPTLVRPLCKPLRRTFNDESLAFDEYQYERPYGARKDRREELTLDRCGRRRGTVLAHSASSIQLASGILTWVTAHPGDQLRPWRYILHARLLRTGKTLTWRVTLPRTRMVLSLQHTARAIYATIAHTDSLAGPPVVWRAALSPLHSS